MKTARLLLMTASLLLIWTGSASAIPIHFTLVDVTTVGGGLPTSQTYSPTLPLAGSGDIDFATMTGTVSLLDYSLFIDVNLDGNDARLDITNWSQTITSIDGSGNITSTGGGTTACENLGGLGGFVCQTVAADPNIPGWAPDDGPELLSSAVIDYDLLTITIIDNSTPAAGTITQLYTWSLVPEPSTGLLLLAGLGVIARRRRA